MDEVSSNVRRTCCLGKTKAAARIVPPRSQIPYWKGPGADSEEKHEPASDIDTVAMDSLKALDPNRPIREADIMPTNQAQESQILFGNVFGSCWHKPA